MSKSPAPAAAAKPVHEFKVGDVVLSKVKGFQAWPSVIIDGENVPHSVKSEKPKGSSYHCVRFIPLGEFGWPAAKDIVPLTPEMIDSFLEKDKKKGSLYKGYETAKNPAKWILTKEEELQKQIETEANAEEDQLADETEEKKTKKRKAPEAKGARKKKPAKDEEETSSKKKGQARTVRKRKAGEESEDEAKPSKKKAKKEDEEEAALVNDPEASKIKEWRHQLQRAFLRDQVKPEAKALPEYDEIFNTIESYQGLTIQYLSYSKIGKVMKKISQLPDDYIPDGDGQFRFRERAGKLVTEWQQILTAKSKETEGATLNGTDEKSPEAAGPDAKADPDVSVMTEA
ncbi:Tudor/PWWP/MBT [Serendipita vermifera]|nr:Tudor/PWWP/MBT [Serendipita vermifera]